MNPNLKTIFILYFAVVAFVGILYATRSLAFREIDVRIKEEVHVANLIAQYQNDLDGCIAASQDSADLTPENCIEAMNSSNLADLIRSWGRGDVLISPEDLTSSER